MTYRPPIASRTWGTRFDSLLTSPPISSPTCDSILDSTAADAAILNPVSPPPTEGKTPHDASIFVGSLPCNVDQAELNRLLSSHLAEHQEIRSVKVVRDSKGGICAFVQCEDASSASSLIQTLRSGPPRPFMGRVLRYEPARAFRTLLISYRSPVQILASVGVGGRRQTIMLDLPYAMRLWKPKDNKYFNVVYNAEAVDIDKRFGGIPVSDRASDARFFMHPVVFDVEAIRSIASFFGVLESFNRFEPDETTGQRVDITSSERQFFPFPHNGPRSACMDSGCWEVKWRHRDDCVSALMTLKRIPHLTVTWAHQPQYATDRLVTRQVKERKTTAAWPQICELSNSPIPCILGGLQSTLSSPAKSNDEKYDHARSIHQNSSFDYDLESDIDAIRKTEGGKLNWSDEDFGPAVHSQEIGTSNWGSWQDQKIDLAIDRKKTTYVGEDQLDVVSTPGLGMSPITQKSFGSGFPSTPTDLSGEILGFSADMKSRQENSRNSNNFFKGKPVDPSTLFVGGLEMFGPNAWDEGKVRKCFEKYGALENVKFVRPYNSCSAFAFVKFKSIDGPTRAIQAEHNRVYGGRAIRVQLRECNVPRGTWKPPRGRGRPTSTYSIKRPENIGTFKLNTDVQRQNQADVVPHVGVVPGHPTEIDGRDGSLEFQSAKSTNHGTQPLAEAIQSEDKVETLNPTDSTAWGGNGNGPAQESLPINASQTNPSPLSMHPFAYHNFGYYPAPWFHPYLQQVQYQFPYYAGYPGYMMPLPMFRPLPQSNADANTSASAQAPWHPSVNSYGPYMPYPQVAQAQVTDITTPYTQLPISSTDVDQAPVAICQTEAIEQYPSGAQTTASQPQANVPVWPQYSYQPFHYPGPLNANAKAFVPPPRTYLPNVSGAHVGPLLGLASTYSPVANARRQSGRKTHPGNTAGGCAPSNRSFVGYTNGTSTNVDSARDNRQAELAKSASISADWM